MICPNLPAPPGLMVPSALKPAAGTAFRSLMGLAKFTVLTRLKNSVRSSMLFDSAMRKRLMIEKSMLLWRGPRSRFRPTFPMSVPSAPAVAAPFELGMTAPAATTGRAKAVGLK